MSSTNPSHQEREWLILLRDGSYSAFEFIYHRYKTRIAGAMLRILKDPELVDDLLQELFVRLWERRSTIDPDQSIKAYLFRVADNLIYDCFRRIAKDRRAQERIFSLITDFGCETEERIFAQEERRVIEAAIALLPPKRRKVFVLCKLESKSYEEVSLLLNISVKTVNDHIYKANQFLRNYLSNHIAYLLLILLQAAIASLN